MRRKRGDNQNIGHNIQQFLDQKNAGNRKHINIQDLQQMKHETLHQDGIDHFQVINKQKYQQQQSQRQILSSEDIQNQQDFDTNRPLKPGEMLNFFSETVREKNDIQENRRKRIRDEENEEIVLEIPNLQYQKRESKIVIFCRKLKQMYEDRFVFGIQTLKRDKLYNMQNQQVLNDQQQQYVDIYKIRQQNLKEIQARKGKIDIEMQQQQIQQKQQDLLEQEKKEEDAGGNRFADLQVQDLTNMSQMLLEVYIDSLSGEEIDDSMSLALNKYFNQFDPGCQNFITEKDYNIGDLVLQFPNPDHKEFKEEFQGMSIGNKDKNRFYETAIGLLDPDNAMEILDYRICKHAFLQVFDHLESSYTLQEKKVIKGLKKKIEVAENYYKQKKKEMYEKDDPENPVNKLREIEEQNGGKKIFAGGGYMREEIEVIDLMEEQKNIIKEQRELRRQMRKERKMQRLSSKQSNQVSFKQITLKQKKQMGSENSGVNINIGGDQQRINIDGSKLMVPLQQTNINKLQSNKSSMKNSLKSRSSRSSAQSGGSQRISVQQKREEDIILQQEQIVKNSVWKSQNNLQLQQQQNFRCGDFLTLMRNLIWLRLSIVGFNMRHFLSQDGKFIFTVIYSNDENLKIAAYKNQMMKSLSLEFSDLLSLEPVDKNLRPLRLNSSLWTDNDYDNMSLKFRYLRERIKELIQEINYKKIVKEINGSHLNSCQFEFGEQEALDDDTPSDTVWELYMDYLIFVRERVQKLRRRYQFSNRQAYLINKVVEPEDRNKFNQYSVEKKLLKQKLKKVKERGKDEPQSDESLSEITLSSDEYHEIKRNLKIRKIEEGKQLNLSDFSLDSYEQNEQNKLLIQQEQEEEQQQLLELQQNQSPSKQLYQNQDSYSVNTPRIQINNVVSTVDSPLVRKQQFFAGGDGSNTNKNSNLIKSYLMNSNAVNNSGFFSKDEVLNNLQSNNVDLIQQQQNSYQMDSMQQQTIVTEQSEVKELLADKISGIVIEKKTKMNQADRVKLQNAVFLKHRENKIKKEDVEFESEGSQSDDDNQDRIDKKKYERDIVRIREEIEWEQREVGNNLNKNKKKKKNRKKKQKKQQQQQNNNNKGNSLKKSLNQSTIDDDDLEDDSDSMFQSDQDSDILELQDDDGDNYSGMEEFREFNRKLMLQNISKKKRVRVFIDGEDQKKMKKEHYIKYRSLVSVLNIKSHKALHSKILKLRKREVLAEEYKKVFLEGLQVVNLPYRPKKVLKNMWDVLGLEPFEFHMKYFDCEKNISFKKQIKCQALWKNYQVTESGKISLFSSMERLKLAFSTVSKAIKPNFLMDNKVLKNVFALNDNFELLGQSQKRLFLPFMLRQEQIIQKQKLQNVRNKQQQQKNKSNQNLKGNNNNSFQVYQQLKKLQNSMRSVSSSSQYNKQQQQNKSSIKVLSNVRKRIKEQNKQRDMKKKLKQIQKKEKRMSEQRENLKQVIRDRQNAMLQCLEQQQGGEQERQVFQRKSVLRASSRISASGQSNRKYSFVDSEDIIRDKRRSNAQQQQDGDQKQLSNIFKARNSVLIKLSEKYDQSVLEEKKKQQQKNNNSNNNSLKNILIKSIENINSNSIQEEEQEQEENNNNNLLSIRSKANSSLVSSRSKMTETNNNSLKSLQKQQQNQGEGDKDLQEPGIAGMQVQKKRYSMIRASKLHLQSKNLVQNLEVYNSPVDTPRDQQIIMQQQQQQFQSDSNLDSNQSISQTVDGSEGSINIENFRRNNQEQQKQNKEVNTFSEKLQVIKKSRKQEHKEKLKQLHVDFLQKLKEDKKFQMHLGVYAQKKLRNLKFLWNFQAKLPWYVPEEEVRQYYGEKITLYFMFLAYYDKKLLGIGILGIISFVFVASFEKNQLPRVIASFIFGVIQTLWSLSFIEGWMKKENLYAIKFGQFKKKHEINHGLDNSQKRHGFVGNYQRSLIDNELNQIYYPYSERVKQYVLNYMVCGVIILAYCMVVMFLMLLMKVLHGEFQNMPAFFRWIRIDITLPSTLNYVLIKVIEEYQKKISKYLTNLENHETIHIFETNYIQKRFLFSFTNVIFPIYSILYINDNIGIGCVEYCFKNGQIYYAVIFVLLFLENIREPIQPIIHLWTQNYKRKKNSLDNKLKAYEQSLMKSKAYVEKLFQQQMQNLQGSDQQKKEFFDRSLSMQKSVRKSLKKQESKLLKQQQGNKKKIRNPFNNPKKYEQVNQFIESESLKEPFSESQDIYGTVEEFMEITILYSFISIFGILFPLVFIISFIWITAELLTDKLKLIKYIQRPFPQDESSIGVWISIFEFVSHLAILTNASLITLLIQQRYTTVQEDEFGRTQDQQQQQQGDSPFSTIILFLSISFINFTVKFGIVGFGQFSEKLQDILKRQSYVINSTFVVFKKVNLQKNKKDKKNKEEKKKKLQQQQQQEQLKENNNNKEKNNSIFLYKEKEKDQSHLSSSWTVPIFKVFACRYFRKAVQVDLEKHDDSFEDISSDGSEEEDRNNKIDIENWEQEMEVQQKGEGGYYQKFGGGFQRKNVRKLWMSSKLVHHWVFVQRQHVVRRLYMKKKDNLVKVREYLMQRELEGQGVQQKQIKGMLKERLRHQYCIGIKGVSFDQFRRVEQVMAMGSLCQQLIFKQNKDYQNYYGGMQGEKQFQDEEEKQEQELKEQEEKRKQEEILFKQNGSSYQNNNQQQQKKKLIPFDINDISFAEIEKYFMPKGKAKLVHSSLLRHEKWAKVLDNRLSIQVKKMIFNKYEQEQLVFCRYDQLFCEQIGFQQIKNQAQQELQSNKQQVQLLHKVTEREQNEKKWLFRFYEAGSVEDMEVQQWAREREQQRKKRQYLVSEEKLEEEDFEKVPVQKDSYQFMSFWEVKEEFRMHMDIMAEVEKKNNAITVLENEVCQVMFSRVYAQDVYQFSEMNYGFYARFYKEHYICSLESMVRSRRQRQMKYKDEQLLHFMVWVLKILVQFQKIKLNHSCIIPENFVLCEEECRKYRLCGTSSLYFCDLEQQRYYFTRKIEKHELFFMPPELVEAQKRQEYKIRCSPIMSDVYMVMTTVLFMMSLGSCVQESKKGRVSVQEYVVKKEAKFSHEYPIAFNVAKMVLLQEDGRYRMEPREILRKIRDNKKEWIREHDFLIIRKRNRVKAMVKKHTLYRYQGSLNHFLFLVKTQLQMNMYEQCIQLVNKMNKSVKEQLQNQIFKRRKKQQKQTSSESEDSQSEITSDSMSSSSFSMSENSFMTVSSRQSPENMKICVVQMYLIQVQAYMSLGKYTEAEGKLKEVEQIVQRGLEEVSFMKENQSQSGESNSTTNDNIQKQLQTLTKLTSQKQLTGFSAGLISSSNNNLMKNSGGSRCKIVNLEDMGLENNNSSTQMHTNRSNMMEDSTVGNNQSNYNNNNLVDNSENNLLGLSSSNFRQNQIKNMFNQEILEEEEENKQQQQQQEEKQDRKSQKSSLNESDSDEFNQELIVQPQQQQNFQQFSIMVTDADQKVSQQQNFTTSAVQQQQNRLQVQQNTREGPSISLPLQQIAEYVSSSSSGSNDDEDYQVRNKKISSNSSSNRGKQISSSLNFNNNNNSQQQRLGISQKSPSQNNNRPHSPSGFARFQQQQFENRSSISSSYEKDSKSSRSKKQKQQQRKSINIKLPKNKSNTSSSSGKNSSSIRSSQSSKYKLPSFSQSFGIQSQSSSSNKSTVSYRSKLEHIQCNVWYLEVYCLYLRCNVEDLSVQQQASSKIQMVKNRVLKKGHLYQYLTSSQKNCIRFFNTLKLEIQFLLDTNQTKQAFSLAGYAIQCINFSLDQQVNEEDLEQNNKVTKLCSEEISPVLLQSYKDDFSVFQCYASIYEMKHNQAFKILRRVVQGYEEVCRCMFEYKKQMGYWVLQLDLILQLNYDRLFDKYYPQFRKLLAVATNKDQQYFGFCVDIYENITQILEFDGFKSEVAVNFLDKLDNFAIMQGGGNFYTNFLCGRYLLMLQGIKERKRAMSLLQVAYGQLDIVQDSSECQVYILKERIIENLIYLMEKKERIDQKFTELYAIQNTRPNRNSQSGQKYLPDYSFSQDEQDEQKQKIDKNVWKNITNHITVQRVIRLRFFKGYYRELIGLVTEQQLKMDEEVKHQMRKIMKFRQANNYNSISLEDQLKEMKMERLKIVDWVILLNFMLGNFEMIGDELYELLKFSHLYDYIITGLFQMVINYKIFGLYQNASVTLQIVEKFIYFLQSGEDSKYYYNKEAYFLQAILLLEEQKIDTQLTEEKQFENQQFMQNILSNRYKAIAHFQQILQVFDQEQDNSDIQQILASLYEQDGQVVYAYYYYQKVLWRKQENFKKEDNLMLSYIKEAQQLEILILKSKYGLYKQQLSEYKESKRIFAELRMQAKEYLQVNKHYLYQKHTKMEYMSLKYLHIFFTCHLLESMVSLGEVNQGDRYLQYLMSQFESMRAFQKEISQKNEFLTQENCLQYYTHFYMAYIAKTIASFYMAHFEYNYAADYMSIAQFALQNYEKAVNSVHEYQVQFEQVDKDDSMEYETLEGEQSSQEQILSEKQIQTNINLKLSNSIIDEKQQQFYSQNNIVRENVQSTVSLNFQNNSMQEIEEVEEESDDDDSCSSESSSCSQRGKNQKRNNKKSLRAFLRNSRSGNDSSNSSEDMEDMHKKLVEMQKKQRDKRDQQIKEQQRKSLYLNVFGVQEGENTNNNDGNNNVSQQAQKQSLKIDLAQSRTNNGLLQQFQLKDLENYELPETPEQHRASVKIGESLILYKKKEEEQDQNKQDQLKIQYKQQQQQQQQSRRISFSQYSSLSKQERDYLQKSSYNDQGNRQSLLNFKSRLSLQGFKYTKFGNEQEVQKSTEIYDYILEIVDFNSFKLELQLQQSEIRSFNQKKLQQEYFNLNNIKKDIKHTKGLHSILYSQLLVLKAQIGIGVIELQDNQAREQGKMFQFMEEEQQQQYFQQQQRQMQQKDSPLKNIVNFIQQEQMDEQQRLQQQEREKEKSVQQALFDRSKFLQEIVNSINYAKKMYRQFFVVENEGLQIKLDYFDNRLVGKAYLVDIGIQFYQKNLYEGVYGMKSVERIYKKIFRKDGFHPDIAQYLYKIAPLVLQEEVTMKRIIFLILQVKEQQLEKLERFQGSSSQQQQDQQKNNKNQKNMKSSKQKRGEKKIQDVQFEIEEFWEELIFEAMKYNKQLHILINQFKKQPDNLALKLKVFYLKFKRRKMEEMEQKKNIQSIQQFFSMQSMQSQNNNNKENDSQEEDQEEIQQENSEQYLKFQVSSEQEIFSATSLQKLDHGMKLIGKNKKNQQKSRRKLTEQDIQEDIDEDNLKQEQQQSEESLQEVRKMQQQLLQEKIKEVKKKRGQILKLRHTSALKDIIGQIAKNPQLIHSPQFISDIMYSAQVELNIQRGFDYDEQVLLESKNGCKDLLQKAFIICKYIWGIRGSHRDNFLYSVIEHNFQKSQYDQTDEEFQMENEFQFKLEYNRPSNSPSPKAEREGYFNFDQIIN